MRRKDREVSDFNKIKEIISSCNCCRIGFNDNGQVYIVPLNFGFTEVNGKYTFYFHSAKDGRKIDIIKKNPYVGFELDTNYKLIENNVACNYSAQFQSIVGNGIINFIEDIEEKKKALNEIMKHNTNRGNWDFNSDMLDIVCVFKLSVSELTCKEHL